MDALGPLCLQIILQRDCVSHTPCFTRSSWFRPSPSHAIKKSVKRVWAKRVQCTAAPQGGVVGFIWSLWKCVLKFFPVQASKMSCLCCVEHDCLCCSTRSHKIKEGSVHLCSLSSLGEGWFQETPLWQHKTLPPFVCRKQHTDKWKPNGPQVPDLTAALGLCS